MSSRANIDMATKVQIVALHNQGLNYSKLSRETGLNIKAVMGATVSRGRFAGSRRSGARPHINSNQRRLMVQGYEEDGFIPTKYYARLFNGALLCSSLEGLHYMRHDIKPSLIKIHEGARLESALQYRNFDRSNVIFNDEKTIKSAQHGRVTRWLSNYIVPNCESVR